MNLQLVCKVIRSRVPLAVVCPQYEEMLAQQQRRTVCHEAFSNLRPVERLNPYAVDYCLPRQVRSLECASPFYICQKVGRHFKLDTLTKHGAIVDYEQSFCVCCQWRLSTC